MGKTKIEKTQVDYCPLDSVTVCVYNIGHFALGVSPDSSITAANYLEKVSAFRALLTSGIPKLFGIVEYSAIFGKNTSSQNVNTKDELFSLCTTQFESEQKHYACYALFADRLPIYNVKINDFECLENETITHTSAVEAQDYRYISADLYLGGEEIKIVVTHLAFDNNRPGVLTSAQIAELINLYSSYENVVMLGDWNVASFDEFDAFVTAGYTLGNAGSIITYPTASKALDNIVAKGVSLTNVHAIPSELSDHYPLLATIIP